MTPSRWDVDSKARIEDVFIEEARKRLAEGDGILENGFPRAGSREMRTLYRHAHTLKGIAHSLGLERIESLSRDLVERTRPFELVEREEVPEKDRTIVREEWAALETEIEAFARGHARS